MPLYRDLRHYLEDKGLLRRVRAEVDKDWELACIMRTVIRHPDENKRYAVLFEHVKGFDIPVVVGALGASREVYATGLGVTPDRILQKWAYALDHPTPPKVVDDGPVKENVIKGDAVDLGRLPIPVWTPGRDTSLYIAGAFVVTKDPETGIRNVGTYRIQVKGRNKTGILIAPSQHIGMIYRKYEELGRPMPVAIVIGAVPAVGFTSVAKIPFGVDEFTVAGTLNDGPIELVECETVELEVPAHAEIVIEGEVPPGVRELEGPFGEYTGYEALPAPRPIVNVKCITHRDRPIYQGIISQKPPSESMLVQGIALEAIMYKHLVGLGFPIRDVCAVQTSGLSTVYISFKCSYPGHAKQLLLAALTIHPNYVKTVVAVDDDVDVRDPIERDWAVAFRFQPDRDIFIVRDAPTFPLDPSVAPPGAPPEERLKGAKLAIDATKKWPYPPVSLPPKELLEKVRSQWDKYGLPPVDYPLK